MSNAEVQVRLPESWDNKKRAEQAALVKSLGKTVGVHELGDGNAALTIHSVHEITDEMRSKITAAGFTILSE